MFRHISKYILFISLFVEEHKSTCTDGVKEKVVGSDLKHHRSDLATCGDQSVLVQ